MALTKKDVAIGAFFGTVFSLIYAWMLVNVPEYRWFANIYILSAITAWFIIGVEWITRGEYPVWEVWGYVTKLKDLIYAPICVIITIITCAVISKLMGMTITLPFAVYTISPNLIANIFIIGICVPFYEETLFLGIIPPSIINCLLEYFPEMTENTALAISAVISGFMFAVFHWFTYNAMISMLIVLFIYRVVTVIIAYHVKSIGFAIIAHAIINTLAVITSG